MFAELINNAEFVWVTMSVIVLIFTQIIKLPFKFATKHIGNANARARINALIMLIPLALGIGLQYFYCAYIDAVFHVIEGLKVGGGSIVMYSILEKMLKGSNSESTVAVKKLYDDIVSDGKVDKSDKSAVAEFLKKAK